MALQLHLGFHACKIMFDCWTGHPEVAHHAERIGQNFSNCFEASSLQESLIMYWHFMLLLTLVKYRFHWKIDVLSCLLNSTEKKFSNRTCSCFLFSFKTDPEVCFKICVCHWQTLNNWRRELEEIVLSLKAIIASDSEDMGSLQASLSSS